MGINITTQLLLLMGSRLQVESVYGEGSRFYFSLEQQIIDSTSIGNLEERIRKQSKEYSYTSTFTAPEANILVVDDNLINLKVFVNLLKRTKLNVDVADRGKECLALIEKKHYDLIFLDHMMPEMDGVETLHRMKAMEENTEEMDTPVTKMTVVETELPIVDGIDWSCGLMHLKEPELLMNMVEDFYKILDAEADKLEQFYEKLHEDGEITAQYRIKIHSLQEYQYADELQSQIEKLSVLVTNMEVDEIVEMVLQMQKREV